MSPRMFRADEITGALSEEGLRTNVTIGADKKPGEIPGFSPNYQYGARVGRAISVQS